MNIRINKGVVLSLCVVFLVSCASGPPPKPPVSNRPMAEVPSLKDYLEQSNWDTDTVFSFPEQESFVLPNRLKVVVVPRHDLPMVYFRAQIRGGSIYDPPGKEGLSYLTGWVLTEGTESYSNDRIDDMMDSHGAYVTSVAYNESCIATMTCLSKDVEVLFPCFSEILSRPAFTREKLDESRRYLIGEIKRIMDDPGELCYRRFRRDVFGDHPYAKPRKGTIEGLKACSRQDVLDFYHRYYTPDHAVLVIVGDIEAAEAERLCREHLMDWKPSTEPLPEISAPKAIEGRHIYVVDKDTVQAQINIGHVGIDRTNPDRFRIETMNRILGGGGLYSRLATEVRVKRGLTYSVYSFFARREFTGEFAVSTFTKVSTVGETIRVILEQLEAIRKDYVSETELKDAKEGLIGAFPLQFEEYEGIAETLVHINFYKLPLEDITNYPLYIQSVSKVDVLRAAQKYIHPDDIVITIVGPADDIVPQLRALGPVEVVAPV